MENERDTTMIACPNLFQVPNGNPEPDGPEDCYDLVPCGEPMERWDCGNCYTCPACGPMPAYSCDHSRPLEAAEALVEHMAGSRPDVAAQLDDGVPWHRIIQR